MTKHRILLVDDEADILEFVRYNLLKEGYEVHTASNGAEALEVAAATRPHLILLDRMMPVMDGAETCRAIRRDPRLRGTIVVFLSALGEEEQQLQDLSYYLAKLQAGYGTQHQAQLTLVVDELDQSFPSGSLQKNRKNGYAFLCCRGRHFGINIIGISQRMHLVDNVFRANCSGIYLYRHAEPADIDIGVKMLGREYRDAFQKLNNFEMANGCRFSASLLSFGKMADFFYIKKKSAIFLSKSKDVIS